MPMAPRSSKLTLTSHISFSVGWLGAVAVFLSLAIVALTTTELQVAQAAFVAMEISTLYVIIPFCLASLITGLIQAVGTRWGLFKYYWIVVKLFLTVVMTVLLFLHLQPISYLAGVAVETTLSKTNEAAIVIDLIKKAGGAIIGLLAVITISVYKPWGKIQYKQHAVEQKKKMKPVWSYVLIALICLLLLVIIMHLLGGGMGKH
jgi:hypothetical protein